MQLNVTQCATIQHNTVTVIFCHRRDGRCYQDVLYSTHQPGIECVVRRGTVDTFVTEMGHFCCCCCCCWWWWWRNLLMRQWRHYWRHSDQSHAASVPSAASSPFKYRVYVSHIIFAVDEKKRLGAVTHLITFLLPHTASHNVHTYRKLFYVWHNALWECSNFDDILSVQ